MEYSLNAVTRTITGKAVSELRTQDQVPGVIYGHGVNTTSLTVKRQELEKVYEQAGTSSLVNLTIDGQSAIKGLINDMQFDPIQSKPTHFDFYQVNMNEEIETEVPIVFVGVSPAVKELNGVLVHNAESVTIRCLPGNLLHEISVDISVLKTFEDKIHVSDLQIPSTIEIVGHEVEDVIALVSPPRAEEPVEVPVVAAAAVPTAGEVPAENGEKTEPAAKPGAKPAAKPAGK